jgi:hypothetical protein
MVTRVVSLRNMLFHCGPENTQRGPDGASPRERLGGGRQSQMAVPVLQSTVPPTYWVAIRQGMGSSRHFGTK